MSFDLSALASAVARHGRVARVVVAATAGSVPREVGASMLVWADGQSGTIGGGTLEFDAAHRARGMQDRLDRIALGADAGQCCGGGVTLLTEVWDANRLAGVSDPFVRPAPGGSPDQPLKVVRRLKAMRNVSAALRPQLIDGWMIEPLAPARRSVWIWGAGHVGRALVSVLSPMPELKLHWVDTAADRFPDDIPDGVTTHVTSDPPGIVERAPDDAEHLVLTYSHALDLELCHRILSRNFTSLGLIGSVTKRTRFRKRLAELGHSAERIDRMVCPIGDPALGKHPQAIAVGVAAELLSASTVPAKEKRA